MPADEAVVLGAGIAGLLAAAVLGQRGARVTVVEQDALPAGPAARRGVPQGAHVHGLLIAGRLAIERLLPGFTRDLLDAGAPSFDFAADLAIRNPFGWGARFPSDLAAVGATRPLVEWVVRRRVAALPAVTFAERTRAVGLVGDRARVRAVAVRPEGCAARVELPADLVVDATGRGSRADDWLAELGCSPLPERRLDAHAGYATRLFRIPQQHAAGWRGCFVQLAPPRRLRGGVVLPVEGDRWVVSLLGTGRDRPSSRERDFLPYARSLASPAIADALASAEPLTPVTRSASTASRRRRVERSGERPGNLLLAGDAACCLNPVYAQGMTAAAFAATALADCLDSTEGPTAVGPLFHRRTAALAGRCWAVVGTADGRVPGAVGATPRIGPLAVRYLDRVLAAATRDAAVQLAVLRVLNMLDGPTALLAPATAVRVAARGGAKGRAVDTPRNG